MQSLRYSLAFILLASSGCGSGDGGDPAAVSPSPTPPVATPDPSPPPAPPPVEVPPPAEAKPSITGEVLIKALSWPRYGNDIDGPVAGFLIGEERVTTATVEQVVRREPADSPTPEGAYSFRSSGYMNRDPFIPPRYNLNAATVNGRWAMSDGAAATTFSIGEEIEGNNQLRSVRMLRPGGWVVLASETYELDQTLSQWSSVPDPMTWHAAVQIQSDDVPELFRMCWETKFPHDDDSLIVISIDRVSCGLFNRQSGEFSGVHISDNFAGQGPLVWRSVR